MHVLDDVIAEHAEEAAFLWQQREAAVRAPDYDLSEIFEADERVEAHLDGLRIAGVRGWEIGKELGWELGGEYFAAMSQAVYLKRDEYLEEVLDAAEGEAAATRGLISALGWTDPKQLRGLVKILLTHQDPFRRQLGVAACAVHRVNPGQALEDGLYDAHTGLRARCVKACGELGLVDLLPAVQRLREDPDDECRFWSAWSAGLLGDRAACKVLQLFASADNPRRRRALDLAIRLMPPDEAQAWLRSLASQREQLRWALIGSGALGDPAWLAPIMGQFENPEVARVAGEAFETITGLNIFRESREILEEVEIRREPEEGEEIEGWDEDDEEPELGEDEGLVVPDPDKVREWYDANQSRFATGVRHLAGLPVSPESSAAVLQNGQQRQRQAAALELVCMKPGQPLFETRAPGHRQRRLLSAG